MILFSFDPEHREIPGTYWLHLKDNKRHVHWICPVCDEENILPDTHVTSFGQVRGNLVCPENSCPFQDLGTIFSGWPNDKLNLHLESGNS